MRMRLLIPMWAVSASLALLASPLPGGCQAPPPAPPPALSVTADGGIEVTANGTGLCRAGEVDPQKTPHLDRAFTLRNAGTLPVAVTRLRGSCGCETLLLTKGGQQAQQANLAPGETAQVRVSIRMTGQPSGLLHKYVWVEGPDSVTPLATLEVEMQVREVALAAPAYLNFGTVAAGTAHSLLLTVTADADALPGGTFPALAAGTAGMEVRPVGPPAAAQRDGRASVRQDYRVTLPESAPAGHLAAVLRFPPTAAALAPLAVSVAADVTGRITASPRTLFFGSVPSGRPVTRQVLLSVGAAAQADPISVTSGQPWLTATLHPSPPGSSRVLDVTLGDRTPPGPLQSQVVISAGKDRLILPVIADVIHAPQ